MCDTLKRFGVSMEPTLLVQLDNYVRSRGYANRSQAIRFLVKEAVFDVIEDKVIIGAYIQLSKEALSTRFSKIMKSCEEWGRICMMTPVFVDQHTVCLQFSMEIATESIEKMQRDPILQPLTIYMKGESL